MIPNIKKGAHMTGLVLYLVSQDEKTAQRTGNVHQNPHVIGGDGFLQAWHGSEELSRASAHEISAYLDEPRQAFGTSMKAQVTSQDPETGKKVVEGYKDQHVWHCSLSLRPDEGPLPEDQWERITQQFMDRMGMTEASGKSPCRWVAIHHGASAGGNDHVHIAASMIREDGTRWEGRYNDFKNAQEACRELEKEHGLVQVEGKSSGLNVRAEKRHEREQRDRLGMSQTIPQEMASRIRAAATASTSEAEWIRRCRKSGVVLKPRFAAGTTDVVKGYSAALKPQRYGGKLSTFFGGGTLGEDLTIDRVREGWLPPSVQDAQRASDEWQAAFRGKPPVHGQGRETKPVVSTGPEAAVRQLASFNDTLATVPIGDQAAWSNAATDVSGAMSAWARYDTDNREHLEAAARSLSDSGQLHRQAVPPGRRVKESPMGTALILMAARRDDKPKIAGAVMLRQMLKTAEALRDHHVATSQLRHAQSIDREVIGRLEKVSLIGYRPEPKPEMPGIDEQDREVTEAHRIGLAGFDPDRKSSPEQPGHVLPRTLTPEQERAASTGGRPRTPGGRDGHER